MVYRAGLVKGPHREEVQLFRNKAHFPCVCAVMHLVDRMLQDSGKCFGESVAGTVVCGGWACFDPVLTPQKPLSE